MSINVGKSPAESYQQENYKMLLEKDLWILREPTRDNCLLAESAGSLSQDKLFQKIIGPAGEQRYI